MGGSSGRQEREAEAVGKERGRYAQSGGHYVGGWYGRAVRSEGEAGVALQPADRQKDCLLLGTHGRQAPLRAKWTEDEEGTRVTSGEASPSESASSSSSWRAGRATVAGGWGRRMVRRAGSGWVGGG